MVGTDSMWNGEPLGGGPEAKATKADLVAEVLRHEIATGLRRVGASLPSEAQIMERFAISRPTYREALRILESEGLIRVGRGARGGARVLAPAPQWIARHVGIFLQLQPTPLNDLYAARLAYEPLAARAIAERRDQVALGALAQIAAAQAFSIHDRQGYHAHDAAFRQVLVAHSGNAVIQLIGSVLEDVLRRHNQHYARRNAPVDWQAAHFSDGVKHKRRLVQLMADGDAEGAERAWANYIRTHWRRLAMRVGDDSMIEVYAADDPPPDPAGAASTD